MSYCRWSSNNWACDLYCYDSGGKDEGGYTTHVAGNRVAGEIPQVPDFPLTRDPDSADWKEWHDAYEAQHKFLKDCQREFIDLPHAGETFQDNTLEEFRARLLELRKIGYRFPDRVLEQIEREINEEKDNDRKEKNHTS